MRSTAPSLLPIFRSPLQAAILSRLFLTDSDLSVSELARSLDAPVPTVHREVGRLEVAGLLESTTRGRNRIMRANRQHPAAESLSELLNVTFGPPLVVAEEFAAIGAADVFIFGSWAARYLGGSGRFPADVDVLVIGDYELRSAVYAAADVSQRRLGIQVNPVIRSVEEWEAAPSDALVADIRQSSLIHLLSGGEQVNGE
jgi:DNA-binding transcriptional ArsR family regulator